MESFVTFGHLELVSFFCFFFSFFERWRTSFVGDVDGKASVQRRRSRNWDDCAWNSTRNLEVLRLLCSLSLDSKLETNQIGAARFRDKCVCELHQPMFGVQSTGSTNFLRNFE
jgi:hypothetical protein